MLIKCNSCNNKYDTDDFDNCPNCGDDNEGLIEESDE